MLTDQQIVDIFKTKLEDSIKKFGINTTYNSETNLSLEYSLSVDMTESSNSNLRCVNLMVRYIIKSCKKNNAKNLNFTKIEVNLSNGVRYLDLTWEMLDENMRFIHAATQSSKI